MMDLQRFAYGWIVKAAAFELALSDGAVVIEVLSGADCDTYGVALPVACLDDLIAALTLLREQREEREEREEQATAEQRLTALAPALLSFVRLVHQWCVNDDPSPDENRLWFAQQARDLLARAETPRGEEEET